jgi:cytochrome c oxidase subunit 2
MMNFIGSFFPLPPLASIEGQEIDTLMYLVHLLMLVLFVGWAVFFVVVLVRFRKKHHPHAYPQSLSSGIPATIELGVAAVEALFLFGFSIPFWTARISVMPVGKDVIEINVNAQQFAWNVHYPGVDKKFGRISAQFFADNLLGIDPHDPNGKDDITTTNQLYIPIGRPIVIYLTSRDVMHSFSVPAMRVKKDAIPGMVNVVWFTPIKTGRFEIACAQLCGVGHYRMRGWIIVETEKKYDEWIRKQIADNEQKFGDVFDKEAICYGKISCSNIATR